MGPQEREVRRGRAYRLRLGANESQFGAAPEAIRLLLERASEIYLYCDPTHRQLRETIAHASGRDIENVVVGEGVEGLLEVFARTFVSPGDAVVTSRGTYPTLARYVQASGGRMVPQPYRQDMTIDFDGLIARAHESNAALVYLANPDNPTGRFVEAAVLRQLLDGLPRGCMLLLDEAYVEFVHDQRTVLPLSEEFANLVRLRSFSKAFGLAGARIGYAYAAPEVIDAAERVRQRYGVSKLSQEIAAAAFSNHSFIDEVRVKNQQALDQYRRIAELIGAEAIPSSANFMAFNFQTPLRAGQMVRWCEENDVLVMQPDDPLLSSIVRITTAPEPARRMLEEILVAGAVTALPAAQ